MRPLAQVGSYRGLFDARVWTLTWGQVLQSLGRGVLMPFATLYFYNVQGFPLALIGLAFAIAFPLGALVGLAWGALADRHGRKPLMLVGYGAHAATTAGLAFVQTVPQYFVVILLNSVASAAWAPAARAMVADVTPPARRTRAYGLTYMANNLGLSVGLLVGGVLAVFLPYRALFFAESLGSAAYFLVILFFVRESFPGRRAAGAVGVVTPGVATPGATAGVATAAVAAPGAAATAAPAPAGAEPRPLARIARHLKDLSTPLRDRAFLVFGAIVLLVGIGYGQFYITFSPWVVNVVRAGDAWLAIFFAVNTVMVILLQIPIAHWAERRSRTRVFAIGAALQAASLIATWAAGRAGRHDLALGLMGASVVLLTLQEISLAPVLPALVAGLAGDPGRVAKYMAGLELVFAVNGGAASVVGGAFFDAGRASLLWPVLAAFSLAALPFCLWLARVLPPDVDRPKGEGAPGPADAEAAAPVA